MCIIERIAVHNLDLHALRVAVSLYHELAVHDLDLHALRAAVLLYRELAVYARRNIHFAGEEVDFLLGVQVSFFTCITGHWCFADRNILT